MKNTTYPDCYKKCTTVKYLGIGECENVCYWKFDKYGNALSNDDLLKQNKGKK